MCINICTLSHTLPRPFLGTSPLSEGITSFPPQVHAWHFWSHRSTADCVNTPALCRMASKLFAAHVPTCSTSEISSHQENETYSPGYEPTRLYRNWSKGVSCLCSGHRTALRAKHKPQICYIHLRTKAGLGMVTRARSRAGLPEATLDETPRLAGEGRWTVLVPARTLS